MKALKGNLTTLRSPEPEDIELLYHWENDTDVWQVSNTLTPFSRFTLRRYIETSHLDIYEAKEVRFMIDTIGVPVKTVGTIDIFEFDPFHLRAGVGILIGDPTERGKGFANDALKILLQYASFILKLNQVYCNINASNEVSLKLFQQNGFEVSGEKKQWNKGTHGFESELFLQHIFRHPVG